MGPSESEIKRKIDELSPGAFQRLAEDYARLIYPERFRSLTPSGRNYQNAPVQPWPDAFSLLPDSRRDVVEATHSERWEAHLENDLESVRKLPHGKLAGFLFVAWAKQPGDSDINAWRRKFGALGIPEGNITFVFARQMTNDLRSPRFARVWVDSLHLSSATSLPFKLIEYERRLFGQEGVLESFRPSRTEYEGGQVNTPAIMAQVEWRLRSGGWALVRGRGASGKTVMATMLALGPGFRRGPTYYIDLADYPDSIHEDPRIVDNVRTWADPDVLFVVDNVHLNEGLARTILDFWNEARQGSKLLMLGRYIAPARDLRGGSRPFEDIESHALVLDIANEDLLGVLKRIARRQASRLGTLPDPPHDVVDAWKELFGGDLIAFSAAVCARLTDLFAGRWRLAATDAIDYVRQEYLAGTTDEERKDLIAVAVLAEIEISTPASLVSLDGLRRYVRDGIVYQTEVGRSRFRRFSLVHPGLGQLLIAASDIPVDRARVLQEAGAVSGPLIPVIPRRLELASRPEDYVLFLTNALSDRNAPAALLRCGLHYADRTARMALGCAAVSARELDILYSREGSAIDVGLWRTPLNFLVRYLEYSAERLPQTYCAAANLLQDPANADRMKEQVLGSPLDLLVTYLEYTAAHLPQAHGAATKLLQDPANASRLTEQLLDSPLNLLVAFLVYAAKRLPHAYDTAAKVILRLPPRLRQTVKTLFPFNDKFFPRIGQ